MICFSVESDHMLRLFINCYVFLIQRLPKNLSVSCGIEPDEEGSAGLRLTARAPSPPVLTAWTQTVAHT